MRDVYDALMSLTAQVHAAISQGEQTRQATVDHEGRIRSLEGDAATAKEAGKSVVDHEMRLRDVERWRRALPVSLLVSLASVVIAAIGVFA